MKTLILIRHGKSDWSAGLPDRERPLNQRGLNDAPIMAKVLQREGYIPDLMYVSSAKRTSETAQILAKHMAISDDSLLNCPELYLCFADTMLDTIEFAPNEYDTIAIVGHNPTISEVAGHFCKQSYVEMPTLGTFICEFDCDSWAEISEYNKVERQFFYPKLFK